MCNPQGTGQETQPRAGITRLAWKSSCPSKSLPATPPGPQHPPPARAALALSVTESETGEPQVPIWVLRMCLSLKGGSRSDHRRVSVSERDFKRPQFPRLWSYFTSSKLTWGERGRNNVMWLQVSLKGQNSPPLSPHLPLLPVTPPSQPTCFLPPSLLFFSSFLSLPPPLPSLPSLP